MKDFSPELATVNIQNFGNWFECVSRMQHMENGVGKRRKRSLTSNGSSAKVKAREANIIKTIRIERFQEEVEATNSTNNSFLKNREKKKNKSKNKQLAVQQPTEDDKMTIFSSISEKPRRKLILHFDVRNTVLVADSVTNIGVEEALNAYLTGVVWGNLMTDDGLNYTWHWHSDEPLLTPPRKDSITFYKFLERRLVKSVNDRLNLRAATGNFTETEIGVTFHPFFERHLEMLEWTEKETNTLLTMKGKNGKNYHYILPAFFRLLQYLIETNRDFAVIFRTYGCDCYNVLAATAEMLSGNHPLFAKKFPVTVDPNPGRLIRGNEHFVCDYKVSPQSACCSYLTSQNEVQPAVTNERSIYKMMSSYEGVCGYVDEFIHWQTNNYSHLAAKPLWIDLDDKDVHHIFFDDNIRLMDEDSIVNLRLFDSETNKEAVHSLTTTEMAQFENVCLVQSDLLKSISDREYFVDKVRLCEANYDDLVRHNFDNNTHKVANHVNGNHCDSGHINGNYTECQG